MSTIAIASEPAAPPARALTPPRPRSIRWALARVEGRRLVAHPLFLLGMATSVAALALTQSRGLFVNEHASMLAGDCFVLLGGAVWTFLVACLAAGRVGRDGAQDFYAGQPVAARLRTEALLLSLGFAGLASAALIGLAALAMAGLDGTLVTGGETYDLRPLELVQGPLYLVTAGALGVLVGSWTPRIAAAVLGAFVLFLPPVALVPWFVFDETMSRGFYGAVMAGLPVGWQLTGLAGLTALAGAGALARHDRRPAIMLLALVGLAVALAAFVLVLTPPTFIGP